jgi:hypothetical protein
MSLFMVHTKLTEMLKLLEKPKMTAEDLRFLMDQIREHVKEYQQIYVPELQKLNALTQKLAIHATNLQHPPMKIFAGWDRSNRTSFSPQFTGENRGESNKPQFIEQVQAFEATVREMRTVTLNLVKSIKRVE